MRMRKRETKEVENSYTRLLNMLNLKLTDLLYVAIWLQSAL